MRVEETTKIIPERKEVTVTYYGNCPKCNLEQKTVYKHGVDRLCDNCVEKKRQVDRQIFLDTYVGSKILSVSEKNNDVEIIIKTKEGKVFRIDVDVNVEYQEYTKSFEFKELHEGDAYASWFIEV